MNTFGWRPKVNDKFSFRNGLKLKVKIESSLNDCVVISVLMNSNKPNLKNPNLFQGLDQRTQKGNITFAWPNLRED